MRDEKHYRRHDWGFYRAKAVKSDSPERQIIIIIIIIIIMSGFRARPLQGSITPTLVNTLPQHNFSLQLCGHSTMVETENL
jgi:hypothetical protein